MAEPLLDPAHCMAAALAIVVVCFVVYVVHSGLFSTVRVAAREPGRAQLVVAYKTGRGPYKAASQLFTDACSLVMDREHIGVYYDDPDSVPESELRFAVGTVLAQGNEDPDPSELELMTQHGYKIAHFPKPNFAVMASFPFTTTLSIYLAIFRVYPKLKEFIAKNGLCAYPALEIYGANTIDFVMPLSKQEEFFVPEFSEEQVSIATTEVSNHPDHAGADEELARKKIADEEVSGKNVFAKPTRPAPKPKNESSQKGENSSLKTEDSSSSFEDLTDDREISATKQ